MPYVEKIGCIIKRKLYNENSFANNLQKIDTAEPSHYNNHNEQKNGIKHTKIIYFHLYFRALINNIKKIKYTHHGLIQDHTTYPILNSPTFSAVGT